MTTTDGLEEKNQAHIYNIVRKIDDTAGREPRNETNSPPRAMIRKMTLEHSKKEIAFIVDSSCVITLWRNLPYSAMNICESHKRK